MKRDLGFIDITDCKKISEVDLKGNFWFEFDDDKYFFKKSKNINSIYNELIAEELANQFGIRCAHYDLGSNQNNIGNISKNFISKNDNFMTMRDVIIKSKLYENEDAANNLISLWNVLSIVYKDDFIVKKLMNQLVDIFIFDVFTSQFDRHCDNFGIIENSEINISPLYDNEFLLYIDSMLYGKYNLGVDIYDNYLKNDLFKKFLYISSRDYLEFIKSKLYLIENDNIIKILNKIEYNIDCKINIDIRNDIIRKFDMNKEIINKEIKIYE